MAATAVGSPRPAPAGPRSIPPAPRGSRGSRSDFAACSSCGTKPGPRAGSCSTRRRDVRAAGRSTGPRDRQRMRGRNSLRRTSRRTTPTRCRACRTGPRGWGGSCPPAQSAVEAPAAGAIGFGLGAIAALFGKAAELSDGHFVGAEPEGACDPHAVRRVFVVEIGGRAAIGGESGHQLRGRLLSAHHNTTTLPTKERFMLLPSLRRLFVAQGLDGVQTRRFPGGIEAEQDAHGGRNGHGGENCG